MPPTIYKGRVVNFKGDREFGFVQADQNREIFFFHLNDGRRPMTCLDIGQPELGSRVIFSEEPVEDSPARDRFILFETRDPPRASSGRNDKKRRVSRWCFVSDWLRVRDSTPQIRATVNDELIFWVNSEIEVRERLERNGPPPSEAIWWERPGHEVWRPGINDLTNRQRVRLVNARGWDDSTWTRIENPQERFGI